MEWAINRCREEHGEKPLKYYRGPIAQISAYLAYLSRGMIIDVEVPADDPHALVAYEDGKRFYYSKRGQLNFSCASCHVTAVGKLLRAELLGPRRRPGEPLPGLPQGVGGNHDAAPQLRGMQSAVAGRIGQAAVPGVSQPRVLPHLHEQRNSAQRTRGPPLMVRATTRLRYGRPRRLAATAAAVVLAAGAWGWAPPAPANDEATFMAAYEAAVAARKAAVEVGYELARYEEAAPPGPEARQERWSSRMRSRSQTGRSVRASSV